MGRLPLAVVTAALAWSFGVSAATSVSTAQWVATTDPAADLWTSLELSGDSVVAPAGPGFGAEATDFDIRWGYALDFAALPGWTITGYDVALSVDAYVGQYNGQKYDADPPPFVSLSGPLGGGTFGSSYSGTLLTHLSGATLPNGSMEIFAHPQSFCTVPIDQCMGGMSLGVYLTVNSLTITPDVVADIPEPTSACLFALGLAGLAARRRFSGR